MVRNRHNICFSRRNYNDYKPALPFGRASYFRNARRGRRDIVFPRRFFVEFPKSPLFWALVILEAFISTFYNARIYAAAAMYGAGSASRINVLSIAFGLVFWWILDYRQFLRLWANPVEFF